MWEQRARLIEDMRQLADEVLNVADDALDRMEPPVAGEEPLPPVDDTTAEAEIAGEPTVEASTADIPVPPENASGARTSS